MTSRCKVLLVDDDVNILAELGPFLDLEGYQVLCARDGEDALRKAASFDPHMIILDIRLPRINGREVLRQLRACGNGVPVLLLTEVTGADARALAGLWVGGVWGWRQGSATRREQAYELEQFYGRLQHEIKGPPSGGTKSCATIGQPRPATIRLWSTKNSPRGPENARTRT